MAFELNRVLMSRAARHLMVLILVLLAVIILPFVVWGEHFEAALSLEGARAWMEGFGQWAWLAGVSLLVADIVLPIPGTVVMSAMGWMYGWFWGGCISALGSVLSGGVAYGLCRLLGRPVAVRIAGEDGLAQAHVWFDQSGGWLVAMSRWLPVLPEAVACLAGLAQMRWRTFWVALVCGSLPLGFAFAAIGDLGHASPLAALALSALVPAGMWWLARRWQSRQSPK
jgi:uncharacterized membrane protein YdjX (TVP38/TMEM64 family)